MHVNEWIEQNKVAVNTRYKPKYHFSAPIGWINDPNGFVYFKGEYHLFYQYHPYSSKWGPMHWGHAKTKDLIHWEHLPVALTPDQPYDKDGCFSGTALVVDDTLLLMYTGHRDIDGQIKQVQCLAKSTDGIHFEKFKTNPVIDERHVNNTSDFRDPKLFKRGNTYYSLVASTTNHVGNVLLFQSPDLENWTFTSVFLAAEKNQGTIWECPDLFTIGDKDILIVSPIGYAPDEFRFTNVNSSVWFIGKVDWQTGKFLPESVEEIDGGLDFYAAQTLIDDKNRRIMIAWQQMWGRNIPTDDLGHGWAGSMIIPKELSYDGGVIKQDYLSEFYDQFVLSEEKACHIYFETEIVPLLSVEFEGDFTINIGTEDAYIQVSYRDHLLTFDRSKAGYPIKAAEDEASVRQCRLVYDKIKVSLVVDVSTIELLINNEYVFSNTMYPKADNGKIEVHSEKFKVSSFQDKNELDKEMIM